MKDNIIETLSNVIMALDAIAVTGQQNRGNLYGSIETLKDIVRQLSTDQAATNAASIDAQIDISD